MFAAAGRVGEKARGPRVCVLALVCALCGYGGAPQLLRQSRRIMGTYCEIQVYDANPARGRRAMEAALDEMARVDRLLSNYDPASELSVMNRAAGAAPFRASPELFRFLERCRGFYRGTGGTFDPAVGALVRAWGFFSSKPGVPGGDAIAAAKAASGFAKVRLEGRGRTVAFLAAGLEVDPGGIGKGYAVDRAVAVLRRWGVRSALVSAGGSSLYGLGHPPGRSAWRVAIADPAVPDRAAAIVALRDRSLSTSGVSEQSVRTGARRYSHIFDPRSGQPVEGMCQVTVVAPTATETDALTKPAFILPREEAAAVLRRYRGASALRLEGECGASRQWRTPGAAEVFAAAGR